MMTTYPILDNWKDMVADLEHVEHSDELNEIIHNMDKSDHKRSWAIDRLRKKRLDECNEKRHNCWRVCEQRMTDSIEKGKGVRKRKWFVQYLKWICNKIFVDEDTEYEYISKFGRGMWSEEIVKSFSKEDQDYIVNFIAPECGAFDY